MPSLFDVAKHFDDIAITEGYTGAALYMGQFSNFLESSNDGTIAQRRTMSIAPGLAIPARRVIQALGDRWIVGQGNVDGIYDTQIRQSYWTKKALSLYTILTPDQAVLNSAGTTAYGHPIYSKDTVNTLTEAEYDPFWSIYFAPDEQVIRGKFLKDGNRLFHVRSSHREADGLEAAMCDELDPGARVGVVFTTSGVYDPVTDSFAATTTSVDAILMDRYKWYATLTGDEDKFVAGDMTLIVSNSQIVPVAGQTLTISVSLDDWHKSFMAAYARSWTVLTAIKEFGAWTLHIRRT